MTDDNKTQLPPLENPLLEFLGVSMKIWREGFVEMQLPLKPTFLNRTGVVQGGVLCTLLDAAAGYSGIYSPLDAPARQSATLSLTTNFLNNGVGSILTTKGFVERAGKSIFFSRSEVWLDEKVLLATAVGTFKYLRPTIR